MHQVRLLSRPDLLLWQLIETVLGGGRRTMTPAGDQGRLGHRSERCQGVIGFVFQKIANRALGFLRLMGLFGFPVDIALLPRGPMARSAYAAVAWTGRW
jgi:hypothetical protein